MTVTRAKVHNIDKNQLNHILDFWNDKHRNQLKIGDLRR